MLWRLFEALDSFLTRIGLSNLAFAIKALGNPGGGAERVLVDVANGLVARGHTFKCHFI
jgi:hypothetical protein